MRKLVLAGMVAGGVAYVLGRRDTARSREQGLVEHVRSTVRTGIGRMRGLVAQTQRRLPGAEAPDDATLARKVESEVFRDVDAPKGSVLVNAQEGIVQLRGEVEREELIAELVERTRKVQGVRGVESLLHVVGTEAPMHQ